MFCFGKLGIKNEKIKDINAKTEANKNTNSGLILQTNPKIIGKNTAEIWLTVKAMAVVGTISSGSAIFWKYVFLAIAIEKNKLSST